MLKKKLKTLNQVKNKKIKKNLKTLKKKKSHVKKIKIKIKNLYIYIKVMNERNYFKHFYFFVI